MYTHVAGSTYTIIDGVRRSKAALLAGHATIPATIVAPDGSQLGECELPIDALLSPRDEIPRISQADETRWSRAAAGAQASPFPFPPIVVERASRGKPIATVDFDFGGQP